MDQGDSLVFVSFGSESLVGLPGVAVFTQTNPLPELARYGLDETSLRKTMEKSLFQAGVGVLSPNGVRETEEAPILYLRLSALGVGAQAYVYGINLFFMQNAVLTGNRATSAVTWEKGYLGSVVAGDWTPARENVKQLIRDFCQDWLRGRKLNRQTGSGTTH